MTKDALQRKVQKLREIGTMAAEVKRLCSGPPGHNFSEDEYEETEEQVEELLKEMDKMLPDD